MIVVFKTARAKGLGEEDLKLSSKQLSQSPSIQKENKLEISSFSSKYHRDCELKTDEKPTHSANGPWIVFLRVGCLESTPQWHDLRTHSCRRRIEKTGFMVVPFDSRGWERTALHIVLFALFSFSSRNQVLWDHKPSCLLKLFLNSELIPALLPKI